MFGLFLFISSMISYSKLPKWEEIEGLFEIIPILLMGEDFLAHREDEGESVRNGGHLLLI